MCVPPALQNWFSSVRDGFFVLLSAYHNALQIATQSCPKYVYLYEKTPYFSERKALSSPKCTIRPKQSERLPPPSFFPFSRSAWGRKRQRRMGGRNAAPISERAVLASRRGAATTPYFLYGEEPQRCMGGRNAAPISERAVLASRRGAATTPYFLYGEEPQRRMGGRNAVQTPVKSKAGVYSSLAAVRSWVKPSVMPQLCI